MDILVRFVYDDKTEIFSYNKNQTISSLFEKVKDKFGISCSNVNFIFKSKILKENQTLSQIRAKNNSTITVVEEGSVIGGFGGFIKFTDVSKNNFKDRTFSSSAPDYRTICQGINIYGICKGYGCQVKGKEVICPLKNIKRFDLIEECDSLLCPECKNIITPKTVGFYLCRYKMSGEKLENKKFVPFEINGVADDENSYRKFDPTENGEIKFSEFIIEVEYL